MYKMISHPFPQLSRAERQNTVSFIMEYKTYPIYFILIFLMMRKYGKRDLRNPIPGHHVRRGHKKFHAICFGRSRQGRDLGGEGHKKALPQIEKGFLLHL